MRHDLIEAVFALGGEDDLVRLLTRVEALEAFLGSDDGANLLVAYRRAANIVRIESKKDGGDFARPVETARFAQDEEGALHDALSSAAAGAGRALAEEDFGVAMSSLATLRRPVDDFFERGHGQCRGWRLAREPPAGCCPRSGRPCGKRADFGRIEG